MAKPKKLTYYKDYAWIAKDFEKQVKSNHPAASILWVMCLVPNGDGTGGGRALVSQQGYNPKTYLIYVENDGLEWFTL